MWLGELRASFPLFFTSKIHLMTSYPKLTLTMIYHISSWNHSNISHTKSRIWIVAL